MVISEPGCGCDGIDFPHPLLGEAALELPNKRNNGNNIMPNRLIESNCNP